MLEPTIKYRSAPARARVPEWHSRKALRTANPSYVFSFTEGTFKLHLTLAVPSQFGNAHEKDGDGARVRPRERKEGGNQVGKELHSRSSTLTLEMSQRSSAVSREKAKYRSSPRRTLTRRKSNNLSEWVRAMAL